MKRSQNIRAGLVAFGIAVACAALTAWLYARDDPYVVLPAVGAFMSLTLSYRIIFRRSRHHLRPGPDGPPDDPWQELSDGYQKIGARVVSVIVVMQLIFIGFVFLVVAVTIVLSFASHSVEGEILGLLVLVIPCFAAWRILRGKQDLEVGTSLGGGIGLTATVASRHRNTAETPDGGADASSANRRAIGLLTVPDEFALLSLTHDGKVIDLGQAATGCALAELGDLALRGKLLVRYRRPKLFGVVGVNHLEVELIDTTPAGLPSADALLAELARTGETIVSYKALRQWRQQHDAFLWHRDDLVARGLIRHIRVKRRFLRDRDLYHPDPARRTTLIKDLGSATSQEHPMDAHTMLLCEMVIRSELNGDLGIPAPGHRDATEQVVPKRLRDTLGLLASLVPRRSRNQGGDDGGD